MNLEDIILRGTRANQPAANTVGTGALYYVIDETLLERSNGTSWESYSVAPVAGGINQLTGNVLAGPGTGSQVATIANQVVTNAKLANIATGIIKGRITAATGVVEDLTGTQVTTLLSNVVGDSGAGGTKGLVPAPGAGDAAANKFLKADGTWIAPASSSYWTNTVIKSADQDVENSTVLVDDTQLQLAVLANEIWQIELIILCAASAANQDFKWGLTVSAGTMRGSAAYQGISSAEAFISAGLAMLGVASSTAVAMGTEAGLTLINQFIVRCLIRFSTNGNFKFQFAQNGAGGAGTFARCAAGSILQAKKML